jgi:hypothetical protein
VSAPAANPLSTPIVDAGQAPGRVAVLHIGAFSDAVFDVA